MATYRDGSFLTPPKLARYGVDRKLARPNRNISVAAASTQTTYPGELLQDPDTGRLFSSDALGHYIEPIPEAFTRLLARWGDSRLDYEQTGPGANTCVGISTWLRMKTGHRFRAPQASNFGVAGDTITQMLARWPSVDASPAQYVMVLIGTNELPTITLAQAISKIDQARDLILNSGRTAIFISELPRGDLGNTQVHNYSASDNTKLEAFRQYINAYDGSQPRLYARDCWAGSVDLPNTPYTILSCFPDALHPGNQGAFRVADGLTSLFNTQFPPSTFSFFTALSPYSTLNPTGHLNSAPFPSGSGGAVTGGTVVGVVPVGWVASIGNQGTLVMTGSIISDPARGSGYRMVITGTAAGSDGTLDPSFSLYQVCTVGNVNSGDKLRTDAFHKVAAGASGTRSVAASVQATLDGVTTSYTELSQKTLSICPVEGYELPLKTDPFPMVGVLTTLRIYGMIISMVGGATINISVDLFQAQLTKDTTTPIP